MILSSGAVSIVPSMSDHARACAEFSWERTPRLLDGLPDGRGLNIVYEAVDRHALAGRDDHVAIRSLPLSGPRRDVTYAELTQLTNRFSNVLELLGVRPADHVFVLVGQIPELFVAALGLLKARAVFAPLFAAFWAEPLLTRIHIGRPRVVVTAQSLYWRRVAGLNAGGGSGTAAIEHVIVITEEPGPLPESVHDSLSLMKDLHDSAHGTWRSGAPPFHEWHHGPAEGDVARARGRQGVRAAHVGLHRGRKPAADLLGHAAKAALASRTNRSVNPTSASG